MTTARWLVARVRSQAMVVDAARHEAGRRMKLREWPFGKASDIAASSS